MANVIKHKRGSGSDPSASNLVIGELAIRTDNGKLFTKMDSGAIAEIAGGGSDIAINTLSSSSATGGGSATFNGSAYRFTLSSPPSVSAAQLLVSINGVIQKPVAGTGQPSEGFSVDGTDIILGDAPATGSDFFILTFKSLGVSEPADNSVTSAKIADGAIVNADINASAAIAGTKISPDFGSQDVVTTGNITSGGTLKTTGNVLTVEGATPRLNLTDTNNNSDFEIGNTNGTLNIADSTNSVNRLRVLSNGTVIVTGNLDVGAGLDVTGTITGNNLTLSDNDPIIQFTDANNDPDYRILVESGIFRVQDTTNGNAERLAISSSGRVGIGTASPSRQLHLVGSNPMVLIEGSGGNGRQYALASSDDTTGAAVDGGNPGSFAIYDDTANAARLVINSSGNVGIGTTSMAGKLNVQGSAGGVALQTTDATNSTFRISHPSAAVTLLSGGSSQHLALGTGFAEKMRIDSAGRLLVGSSSISNNGRIQGFIDHGSTAGESGITSVDTTAMAAGVGGEISFYGKTSSSGYNYLGHIRGIKENGTDTNTACALTFHTRPTLTAPGEKMRITSDGFLCIGTTDTLIFNHGSGDDTGTVLDGSGGIQVTRLNDQCGILNRTGTDGTILSFHNDGTCVGFISVTGSTTGYSTNCSDRSLKKNFEDWTEDALSLFKDLKPQKFNYITEDDSKDKTKGYVAQDLVANFPEAYPKNDDGKYVFNPSGMVVYLMKAIQQLEAKVAVLEAA